MRDEFLIYGRGPARAVPGTRYGRVSPSTQIWLSNVQCDPASQLEDFTACPHSPWGDVAPCTHLNDAGVVCTFQNINCEYHCYLHVLCPLCISKLYL